MADADNPAGPESAAANVTPLRPRRPCPECGKPSSRADYPFCSPRCKALDLNRWLSGTYAIPATEDETTPDKDGD